MKESLGSTGLFMIFIVLIMLFTAIVALTINRSNAFAVKDKLVSVIEKYEHFDMATDITSSSDDAKVISGIVDEIQESSYRQTGTCPTYDNNDMKVVGYQRDGSFVSGNNKASFCIVKIPANNTNETSIGGYYYKVIVFYTLDIPVLNSMLNLQASGETKLLYG